MKNKTISLAGKLILVLLVLVTVIAFGCGPTPTPTTNQTTTTPTTQPAKTLKVGMLTFYANPIAVDALHCIQAMADMDNKKGGLTIGGQKYNIEIVPYDTAANPATTAAATNRMISEDKITIILSDIYGVDAAFPITEQNKVLFLAEAITPALYKTSNNYSFNGAPMINTGNVLIGWYCKNNPQVKTALYPAADNMMGKSNVFGMGMAFKAFGVNFEGIYYPPTTTDFSAVATQVKTKNPDVLIGISAPENSILKAAREAGYQGKILEVGTMPVSTMLAVMPPATIEGMIGGAEPTEFDPPTTKLAQEFKAGYIAKFGKWDNPGIGLTTLYSCLTAALKKADSIDVDKLANVLATAGLNFESPMGINQMISRPDIGNPKTIDCITGVTVKTVKNGKPVVVDTINITDATTYAQKALSSAPTGPPK